MDKLVNFPTSRNAKMAYGIFTAFVARGFLNEALTQLQTNPKNAILPLVTCAFLLYTVGLALVRFNTERPLFEPLRARR